MKRDAESTYIGPLKLGVAVERWAYLHPFRIAGYTRDSIDVLVIELEHQDRVGRGEAAGVRYRNDTVASMVEQVERLRPRLEVGLSRLSLQELLPAGGARNAVDCALWDLEAKLSQRPVWQLAGLQTPRALLTMITCGIDTPERMACAARAHGEFQAIKIKLAGDGLDAERVRSVRAARSGASLSVDANQSLTRESLEHLMPALLEQRVSLIEQPFPIGQDDLLDGLRSPIPIAADESVQDRKDIAALVGRVQVINIKLDKCGGLTEGLAMVEEARSHGLDVMVGNMGNTSLGMAPAFLLGQRCQAVDLDGPAFLEADRPNGARYSKGYVSFPEALWGDI